MEHIHAIGNVSKSVQTVFLLSFSVLNCHLHSQMTVITYNNGLEKGLFDKKKNKKKTVENIIRLSVILNISSPGPHNKKRRH